MHFNMDEYSLELSQVKDNSPPGASELPRLTDKEIHVFIHSLMTHALSDIVKKFMHPGDCYVIDPNSKNKGTVTSKMHRKHFINIAEKYRTKFANIKTN